MKRFFVIVASIFWFALASGKSRGSVVPDAIHVIVKEHYTKFTSKYPGIINVICIGNETQEFTGSLARLMKSEGLKLKINLHKQRNLDEFSSEVNEDEYQEENKLILNQSSIVFFDSVARFKTDAPKIKWMSISYQRSQHLVHVPGLTTLEIAETLPNGFLIDEVNFLINGTEKSIELTTSFMFTQQTCRVQQLKTINRFHSINLKWENPIFYPKKYENFHGCELTVSNLHNGDDIWDRANAELLRMIFEATLNAKLVKVNQTILSTDDCDLDLKQDFIDKNTFLSPHVFEVFTFVVQPGEPYTDLERMFMMFSIELWIAIAVTLMIGLAATLCLNFVSDKVRKFIIGRDVRNPTMNLVSIFLTGGQIRTPGRNFARFILILFIMWSMIIRTCHQSMLFEFLQADLRRPTFKTLNDIFEGNLTFYDHIGMNYFGGEYFKKQMELPSTKLSDEILKMSPL